MEDRLYDLIFICMPTTPEEEIAKIVSTLEQTASEHGGKVEKVERWGTRKMAYRVAKQREGLYVYLALHSTEGNLIKELEIKRQQKLVAHREHRARRRPHKTAPPAPAVPPAASPAPQTAAS